MAQKGARVQKETPVQKIVRLTAQQFPSFGGGKPDLDHPFRLVIKTEPLMFEKGVCIEQVVHFVLLKRSEIERKQRREIGDDMRDYINTSDFLNPLSDRALNEILTLKHRDMRRRLREGADPFLRLDKKTRELLLHLPTSWIIGSAKWLLNIRRHKQKTKIYAD